MLVSPWFTYAGKRHQDGAACKTVRVQPHRAAYLDALGRAITVMDHPPQNLGELHQALLDKWAEIPVERL